MKRFLISSIIFPILILVSCAPAPIAPSVTPSPTSTAIPTVTPTPTEIPLPQDLILLQEQLGADYSIVHSKDGEYFEVKDSEGNIVPELRLDDKGNATRTYEFDGNPEFSVPVPKEELVPLPNGDFDTEAWLYSKEKGKWIRQTYSTAGGIGYESDGIEALPLNSIEEIKAILANPKNVDINATENDISFNNNFFHFKGSVENFYYGGTPDNPIIDEPYNERAWLSNVISFTDGTEVKTTWYVVSELKNNISRVQYIGSDGIAHALFGERDLILDGQYLPNPLNPKEY